VSTPVSKRRTSYVVVRDLDGEDLRRAVVKAFAKGRAVIASRDSEAAELVEHGRNGLLYDPGTTSGLAWAIAWAEAFPEKMRQMGDCAKADYAARFVAHWSWHRLFGERRRSTRL
jgi:glycosyltransferase involved in cell wall biosynthesis